MFYITRIFVMSETTQEQGYIPKEYQHITPEWVCTQIADIRRSVSAGSLSHEARVAENKRMREFIENTLCQAMSVLALNPRPELASVASDLKQKTLAVMGKLHDYDDTYESRDIRDMQYRLNQEDPELQPQTPEELDRQELDEWNQAGEELDEEEQLEQKINMSMRKLLEEVEIALSSLER